MKPRSASRQAILVVGRVDFLGIGHVGGPAFEPMLADDDRPPLARLDVLGHQQNAVGEHVGKHVEHDFVAGVQRLVVNLPRCARPAAVGPARSGRSLRRKNACDSPASWPSTFPRRARRGRPCAHHSPRVVSPSRSRYCVSSLIWSNSRRRRACGSKSLRRVFGRRRERSQLRTAGQRRQELLQRQLDCPAARRPPCWRPAESHCGIVRPRHQRAGAIQLALQRGHAGRDQSARRGRGIAAFARLRRTDDVPARGTPRQSKPAARRDWPARRRQTRPAGRTRCDRSAPATSLAANRSIRSRVPHRCACRARRHTTPAVRLRRTRPRRSPRLARTRLACEPIDGSQDFLHFVADDVPAHLERRAIKKLAMRLIRPPGSDGRKRVGPIDERRHDHATAALGQPTGELRLGRDSRRKADELFGRLIGVGQGDDVGHGVRPLGHEQQSFAPHAAHRRPADGKDIKALATADQGRLGGRGDQLERRLGRTRIVRADDLGQASPIGRDRLVVLLAGRDCLVSNAAGGGRPIRRSVAAETDRCRPPSVRPDRLARPAAACPATGRPRQATAKATTTRMIARDEVQRRRVMAILGGRSGRERSRPMQSNIRQRRLPIRRQPATCDPRARECTVSPSVEAASAGRL